MSNPPIDAILTVFFYRECVPLPLPESNAEFEVFTAKLAEVFGGLEQSALSNDIEPLSVSAAKFARSLLKSKCLIEKPVPYSDPEYRFSPDAYSTQRSKILSGNQIYEDSKTIDNYFRKVFRGYLDSMGDEARMESGPVTDSSLLRMTEWQEVEERLDGEGTKKIREQIVALASAVQQADIDERLRSNLLSRVRATQELLTAPDPDWEQVVDILNYRYLTAFLNAVTIINLILGIGG